MYRLYPETGKQLSWNICLIMDGDCCVIIWSIQITKNTHPVPNSILISPFSRPLICKTHKCAHVSPSVPTNMCMYLHTQYGYLVVFWRIVESLSCFDALWSIYPSCHPLELSLCQCPGDFLNRCFIFPHRSAAGRMWKVVQGLCGLIPQLPQFWLHAVLKDLRWFSSVFFRWVPSRRR